MKKLALFLFLTSAIYAEDFSPSATDNQLHFGVSFLISTMVSTVVHPIGYVPEYAKIFIPFGVSMGFGLLKEVTDKRKGATSVRPT